MYTNQPNRSYFRSTSKKPFRCSNCGKYGHDMKSCEDPIPSYGVININVNTNDIDPGENLLIKNKFGSDIDKNYMVFSIKYPDIRGSMYIGPKSENSRDCSFRIDNEMLSYGSEEDLYRFNYYKNRIQFMMVSRKYSVCFIEFVRGRYDVSDAKTIINLFEQMYTKEIALIGKCNYDEVLYYFLNRKSETKSEVLNRTYEGQYSNEYCESKIKFNILVNPSEHSDVPLDLKFYANNITPKWSGPEWGFPKGRRDNRVENNSECACREFEEETGYHKADYTILNRIEPVTECLTGTNGRDYKHTYYLAVNNRDVGMECTNYDTNEIGSIKWFTYDQAVSLIRPYHLEKKQVLTRVYLFVLNYLVRNECDIIY